MTCYARDSTCTLSHIDIALCSRFHMHSLPHRHRSPRTDTCSPRLQQSSHGVCKSQVERLLSEPLSSHLLRFDIQVVVAEKLQELGSRNFFRCQRKAATEFGSGGVISPTPPPCSSSSSCSNEVEKATRSGFPWLKRRGLKDASIVAFRSES
ncbi:unnamed protein product [Linum trigynum]|uniref:Uncharacterized protein n=1 Tax=Linum trigynum TaxID=586398 RepID=A0AAV2CX00_9ROSI